MARGTLNSEIDTSTLDLSQYMATETYEDSVVSARIGVQKAENSPRNDVKDEIERVFGRNHIMYWVAVNESSLDPLAESGTGAEGVFQITQGTWRNFKCSGTHFDVRDNVICAAKIYKANGLKDWRWSEYHGSEGGWHKHLSTSRTD